MSALLKIKSLRAATAETLRLSFGFVRRIHFDCSKSPDKISQLEPQPNTLVECDGSSSSKLQGGGTGVMVTSFNSAFMDFNRAFHPNVQQQYKTTNCSGIMEYIALQNGLNFALELLRERKILSPIVVQTDLESLLPNVEKLSLNLPHNIGNRTIGLCTNICNLLDYMPPDTHLVWNSGSKGNASHYLAKSILIGGQDQNRENRLLWDFYNLHFSFEPQKISQVVQWALALCKSYQIYPGSPVLEIGCGNGMLLQELNKQRFSEDLLGIDSSKGIIGYACHLAKEYGHHNIRFLVDDVLTRG